MDKKKKKLYNSIQIREGKISAKLPKSVIELISNIGNKVEISDEESGNVVNTFLFLPFWIEVKEDYVLFYRYEDLPDNLKNFIENLKYNEDEATR